MSARLLLEALEDRVNRAKTVPFTGQVRLDRDDVYDAVERLRRDEAVLADAMVLDRVDALMTLVRDAKPVPLTEQVRVDRAEIYGLLDEIRSTL